LGRFILGLFALGYRGLMSMCDHRNEPLGTITNSMVLSPWEAKLQVMKHLIMQFLGTIKSRCFLYSRRDHKFLRKVTELGTEYFLMISMAVEKNVCTKQLL
jgi:hypothetical protein